MRGVSSHLRSQKGSKLATWLYSLIFFAYISCGVASTEVLKPETTSFSEGFEQRSSALDEGVLKPKTTQAMSWIDAFLQAVSNFVRTTEAAADADTDAADVNDLDVLSMFSGDRHFRVYRPNPFRQDRPDQVDVHAQAHETVADIHRHLRIAWPDLRAGDPTWQLMAVNRACRDSIAIPPDSEAFLILADVDMQFPYDVTVALVERQNWYPSSAFYTVHVEPLVILAHLTPGKLPVFLAIHAICDTTLCPVCRNRQIMFPAESFRGAHASFVTIAWVPEVTHVQMITGNLQYDNRGLLGRMTPVSVTDVPHRFAHEEAQSMEQRQASEQGSTIPTAVGLQLALTDWYRLVFRNTNMEILPEGYVWICSIGEFPTEQTVFKQHRWEVQQSFPESYQSL